VVNARETIVRCPARSREGQVESHALLFLAKDARVINEGINVRTRDTRKAIRRTASYVPGSK
jgi:hypothetical protein